MAKFGWCIDDMHEDCFHTNNGWTCDCDCHPEPTPVETQPEEQEGEGAQNG